MFHTHTHTFRCSEKAKTIQPAQFTFRQSQQFIRKVILAGKSEVAAAEPRRQRGGQRTVTLSSALRRREGLRGAGSAGCNAELEAPKLCILCTVQCWVAIFLIFPDGLLDTPLPPQMLVRDLNPPHPPPRAVSVPSTRIFGSQFGDTSSSIKPH